ncbi:uncharacterized protein LOC131658488 [Vicia villosa]|uniref:uncharacterized protein LOC131658488 n=1 Tax=Vicia villosa TaxID=3911 RepID=UPI00273A8929|nr:uncharacterized protein LOC131658488 [Vicia villosa]
MIILSYNLRGGGNQTKRKRVDFLIQKSDVDLCFIQETKLSGIGLNLVKEMWGDVDVEWSYLDANGASSGILTMWKKEFFFLNYSFRGEGFLGLCVEKEDERIGVPSSGNSREIRFFNEFIEEMDLVDLPTIGGNFTWFKSNGKAMSRLDRFLLSKTFVEDWKVDGQHIGERDVSDHAPIWLKDNRKDWGPKSFKFNNMWFKHEEFDSFVE